MAIGRRRQHDELLHHSDRGSQYTSDEFQKLLKDSGVTCSMSGAGKWVVRQTHYQEMFGTTRQWRASSPR
jgi:transposase InsO family protein